MAAWHGIHGRLFNQTKRGETQEDQDRNHAQSHRPMFDRGNHCGPFGTHHPIGDKQDQAVQQVETVGHLSQYDRCRPFKQAIEGIPTGNDQKCTCQEQDGRQGVGRRKEQQNRRQTRDRDSPPRHLG